MQNDEWQLVNDMTVNSAPGSPAAVGMNAPQIDVTIQEVVQEPVAQPLAQAPVPFVPQPPPLLHQFQVHQAVIQDVPQPPAQPVEIIHPIIVQSISEPLPVPVALPVAQPYVTPPVVIDQKRLSAAIAFRSTFR